MHTLIIDERKRSYKILYFPEEFISFKNDSFFFYNSYLFYIVIVVPVYALDF